jgi:hypothetical protein
MTLTTKSSIALLVAAVLFALALIIGNSYAQPVQASTLQGQEYQATSTAPSNVYGATIATGDTVIRKGSGSLASVIITGANTGIINFYDATTSNVNLRTGQVATSTILLASLPASIAAGTYIFDVVYSRGLLVSLVSGTIPTSTITYR